MSNEIIVVKQLPVISERLEQIKSEVAEKVQLAKSLVCTEDTVKSIKKTRAELNAELKAWEEQRKNVKAAVMSPYEQFEAVYKDCITNAYKEADTELKRKIDSVESELKAKKEQEVKEYFAEYLLNKGIDFVTYENARINVTLSASLKSLKEQAKTFIDKIADDLALIETQEHKAEILVEYKNTLNVSAAITSVTARIKAIEEEKARQAAEEARKAEQQKPVESPAIVAPISAPTEETETEKEYTVTFKVTATLQKLKDLKKFISDGEYKLHKEV